jgi:hypothetical protein
MMDIAEREAQERGITGIEWRTELPSVQLDWVNSHIVFQHIPPERGYAIFDRLLELLAPGGLLSVHVTFFRDRGHVAEITRDLGDYRFDGKTVELLSVAAGKPGDMTMFDYDLNRLLRSLFRHDFAAVTCEHTDHGGCHGVVLYGVKSSRPSSGASPAG